MALTISNAYRLRLERGEIAPDPGQGQGLHALAELEEELNAAGEPSRLRLFGRPKAPRGIYLWGPVGRGKSMLMDLFFQTAPVAKKRRLHFYAFMAEVHALIDAWRKGDPAARRARFGQARGDDPIVPVAELIARDARLLCFDELQVADPADAMILGRLFGALLDAGVTVVATSNRAPADLYQGGVNRQLFTPFIDQVVSRMQVIKVAGARDYRLERLMGMEVYFAPITREAETAFDSLWRGQLNGDDEAATSIEVLGRRMRLPRAAGNLLRTPFADLCATELGPQDYLALAGRFHTLFLEDVPVLGPDERNEARRLVWLVDALYEARTRLVMLAQAEPEALYARGDGSFEFERTASRLEEMRSAAWLEAGE